MNVWNQNEALYIFLCVISIYLITKTMTALFLVYICLFIFALYKYDYIFNKVGPTTIGQAHGTFFRKLLLPFQSQSHESSRGRLVPSNPT